MQNQCVSEGRETGVATLPVRLRSIREEKFGEDGVPELAGRLGFPPRTWRNYEGGVSIPGEVLLRYLHLTGAEPLWLLEGEGAKYRVMTPGPPIDVGR